MGCVLEAQAPDLATDAAHLGGVDIVKLWKLTGLAFELNAALDSGKHKVSIEEVHEQAEAETVLKFLAQRFGKDLDLSGLDVTDRAELEDEWHRIDNGLDAERKVGVKRNGLCLLVAYALESIRQRVGDQDVPTT